jgi:hypothetical protein
VLEPHLEGRDPAFIPADADMAGAGSGDRDALFDRSGTPIGEDVFVIPDGLGADVDVDPGVVDRLTAVVPPREGWGGDRTAAAELHVAGADAPVALFETAGVDAADPAPTEGLTGPERHVLRPDEQPLHNQVLGEFVPADEPRREQYLQDNRVQGPHAEHPGPRSHDAEAKVLERASQQLAVNPDAAGELHLRPSHPPCPACTAAIFGFTGRHPNVRVILH